MDPTTDRRTRRRLERAEQVYDAAIELFVDRGYEATTMDDIADRADVGRGSVFNYYPRKRAFLDEWLVRRRRSAAEAVQAQVQEASTLAVLLRRYMDELAAINVASREETVALMSAVLTATDLLRDLPLANDLAALLLGAQARGELRADIDPAQAGLVLATGYYVTIAAWTGNEPAPFDLRDELHGLVDLVTGGILAR